MPNGRLEGRLEGVFICTVVQFGLFSVCIRVYDKYTLAKGLVRIRKREGVGKRFCPRAGWRAGCRNEGVSYQTETTDGLYRVMITPLLNCICGSENGNVYLLSRNTFFMCYLYFGLSDQLVKQIITAHAILIDKNISLSQSYWHWHCRDHSDRPSDRVDIIITFKMIWIGKTYHHGTCNINWQKHFFVSVLSSYSYRWWRLLIHYTATRTDAWNATY